jgi:hypothetical protein
MDCRRLGWATAAFCALALNAPTGAWAGSGNLSDEQEEGVPYFGFVRDSNGAAIADARVTAEFKAGGASLITRSDAAGAYSISAFGADTNPNDVAVTCSKDGYRFVETVRRDPNVTAGHPVEADCLLAKP